MRAGVTHLSPALLIVNPRNSYRNYAKMEAALSMIVLNFSHPLTNEHITDIEKMSGKVSRVINIQTQFNLQEPFGPQIEELMKGVETAKGEEEWTEFLVNPPSLSPIAVMVIAEIRTLMGRFPRIIRMRQIAGSLPPKYGIAEIITLKDNASGN